MAAALCCGKIVEPMQYDGTMDSMLFEEWFRKLLCPALERGKVFIMDNAAFHRKAVLERIAADFGHRVIFLPPYSPEYTALKGASRPQEWCMPTAEMVHACRSRGA